MNLRESVLVAIALCLLAGVIIYNVFTAPKELPVEPSQTVSTEIITVTSTLAFTDVTPSEASETTAAAPASTPGPVNINTADLGTLMTLNGIGEVKAQAIIDYRTNNGAFSSVEDLLNVTGIGEKTLEKLRNQITV